MTGRVGRLARRPGVSLLVAALLLAGLGVTADLTAPSPEPTAATVPALLTRVRPSRWRGPTRPARTRRSTTGPRPG